MVARAPWLLQQIATEHHTIGTHTWSHRYLNVIRQGAEDQIVGGLLAAAKAVGPQSPELSPFFRFPGFGRTARLDHFLDAHGMVPFSVDVVGDDWTAISSDEVLRRTLSRLEARRGGILLLHDIHARTLAMLPRLLTELKARGFSIVHIVPEKGDAQTALASLPPLSSNRMRLAVARIPTAAPINFDLAPNGQGDVVMLADPVAKDGKPQVPIIPNFPCARRRRRADRLPRRSNRLETLSSLAVWAIASPIGGAMEITRILLATRTASVGAIVSVTTSSFSREAAMRATAPPDNTPWVI